LREIWSAVESHSIQPNWSIAWGLGRPEESVDTAPFLFVREKRIGHIERNAALLPRDLHDIARLYVAKLRLAVDEARDEPGAGDTVDLRPFPRNPQC